jgi:hypothetical protein
VRAIRVRKRSKGDLYAIHWLTDDESTRCGLDVDDLQVTAEFDDLDRLPPLEACGSCSRVVEGWTKPVEEQGPIRQIANAPRGRISKAGPLRHTARSGHGHPLR